MSLCFVTEGCQVPTTLEEHHCNHLIDSELEDNMQLMNPMNCLHRTIRSRVFIIIINCSSQKAVN